MSFNPASVFPPTETGLVTALLFALVAERLTAYYEHDRWLTLAQGVTLSQDWLSRSKRTVPTATLRALSADSDELARQMAAAFSREVGLLTAHEMMESLDPRYHSELGQTLMEQCAQRAQAVLETLGNSDKPL